MAIRAHYTNKDGAYLNAIPARDLSDEEYDALSKEQKALVRSSGLYSMEGDNKPAAPKKDGD